MKVTERQKTEAKMMWLFQQMVDEYHKYNPDGNYLSLCYRNDEGEGYMSIYNASFREEGADFENPIDVSKFGEDDMFSYGEVK